MCFLNRETKLTYAYDKKKKTHTVKLKGEAYFNIHHEDDKTFAGADRRRLHPRHWYGLQRESVSRF